MAITLNDVEKLAEQLPAQDKLTLIEHLAHGLSRGSVQLAKRPAPAKYYKGRPVYTKEQLAQMDNTLPDESEWVAEIEKRAARDRK